MPPSAQEPGSDSQSFRASLERASRPWLLRLSRLPRPVLLIATVAIAFGGFLLPGYAGAALLLVIAAFFGWLLMLAWPALSDGGRLLRGLVVVALVGGAIAKAAGVWG